MAIYQHKCYRVEIVETGVGLTIDIFDKNNELTDTYIYRNNNKKDDKEA